MDTETREIPRNEWKSFFDAFSKQHEGWLATLEILDQELGAQEEAHELPLEGVSLTSAGNEPEAISIDLGSTSNAHVSHSIPEPAHVRVQQTSEGANAALEIEANDGTQTLLRFRSALPSEMVDGLVLD
jgi:Family of unknown function (DUF5335)